MKSIISFPGLGIGEFEIDRIAFSIGSANVTWYGIIICIGIICAFAYVCFRANQSGIVFDTLLDFALITVPCAIIGARLYYVLFKPEDFDSLYDVIAIWNGGLAIYGAIIVGAIVVFLICKYKKIDFFMMADIIAPGVMIGQAIGRWGNFANGEAFGSQTTLPWRMRLCNHLTDYETIDVHPTFLYESLWNIAGFILINIFYKKKKFNGEILFWYLSWYGLGRFFIEQLRTDSLYIGNTGIRVSALFGLICALVSLTAIIVGRIRHSQLAKAGMISTDETADFALVFWLKKQNPEKSVTVSETKEEAPDTEEQTESKKPENDEIMQEFIKQMSISEGLENKTEPIEPDESDKFAEEIKLTEETKSAEETKSTEETESKKIVENNQETEE